MSQDCVLSAFYVVINFDYRRLQKYLLSPRLGKPLCPRMTKSLVCACTTTASSYDESLYTQIRRYLLPIATVLLKK